MRYSFFFNISVATAAPVKKKVAAKEEDDDLRELAAWAS